MNNDLNYSFLNCCGAATCGKNTLVNIFRKIFPSLYIDERAFATELRLELDPITKSNFGISAFTKDSEEKSIIRPLMVSWAHIRRVQSKGKYFWQKLEPHILESLKEQNNLLMISDFRFAGEYPEDEDYFIKKNNGVIIHITRYNKDGSVIPPNNSTEAIFENRLKEISHYQVSWSTSNDLLFLEDLIRTQLKDLIEKIKNKYGIEKL